MATIQQQWRTRARATGDITYADGRLAAEIEGGKWIMTTPNADWIPEVLVGRITISYHEDGRFGAADPTQWPQLYSARFPHFCLMPRPPTEARDPRNVMWETLTARNFHPAFGCALTAFGVASDYLITRLQPHIEDVLKRAHEYSEQHNSKGTRIRFTCAAMSDSYKRLSYPATFRDINRQLITVQRFWKESLAFLTWVQDKWEHFEPSPSEDVPPAPVNHQFIGAYTTDAAVVQILMRAGVPVWLLRQPELILPTTVVLEVVSATNASSIINTVNPTFALYHGMIGDRALSVTCMGGHTYSDVEHVPHHDPDISARPRISVSQPKTPSSSLGFATLRVDMPVLSPNEQRAEMGPAGSSLTRHSTSIQSQPNKQASKATRSSTPYQHPSPGPNRNPFVDSAHVDMPAPLSVWSEELRDCTKSVTPLRRWGYLFPDPGLFVTCSSGRAANFFFVWLGLRVAWVTLHENYPAEVQPLLPQTWRDILGSNQGQVTASGHQTSTSARKHKSQQALDHIFEIQDITDASFAMTPPFLYRSHVFQQNNVIPQHVRREILWEIYHLGFRAELLALDRHLVPSRYTDQSSLDRDEFNRRQLVDSVCGGQLNLGSPDFDESAKSMSSLDIRVRLPSIEAFRQILIRWPSCPPSLVQLSPLTDSRHPDRAISIAERLLIKFYLRSFYLHTGRPALVPHAFPV
ncbi:hypothetical protein NLI96_g6758 [Meripilus lineatus]|uniref:Uncharacterized protein n=1 Tax=Meripilus lineatus TaxID=2056292 RepID=A0AAD5V0A8_9APHY|nr:hypothetical protein NLI96_g6758 [Physisporinus lineatus]